ncbi:MAG TPA: hypothetical protein VE710_03755 [Candidatus Bathyarchaeia archaeon]|nr:hypothetical protein [Candidatus Bathyarchaeia archaeon]
MDDVLTFHAVNNSYGTKMLFAGLTEFARHFSMLLHNNQATADDKADVHSVRYIYAVLGRVLLKLLSI